MKKIIFITALLMLASFGVDISHAKIVTMQGSRYYQIVNNSFIVQANGSIDELDAQAIVRLLKRYHQQKEYHVAREIFEDIHLVYKGPLLGEMYKYCLLGHLEVTYSVITEFTRKQMGRSTEITPILSAPVDARRINSNTFNCWYEYIHTEGPFKVTIKKERVEEIIKPNYRTGLSIDQFTNKSATMFYNTLDSMLAKIYDNASIRGCYGPIEKLLPEIHKDLSRFFNKARVIKYAGMDPVKIQQMDHTVILTPTAQVLMKYANFEIGAAEREARERKKAAEREAIEENRRQVKARRLAELTAARSKYGKRAISTDGRFVEFINGVVLDTEKSLMWPLEKLGRKPDDARLAISTFDKGGYTDWRAPTEKEVRDFLKTKYGGGISDESIKSGKIGVSTYTIMAVGSYGFTVIEIGLPDKKRLASRYPNVWNFYKNHVVSVLPVRDYY